MMQVMAVAVGGAGVGVGAEAARPRALWMHSFREPALRPLADVHRAMVEAGVTVGQLWCAIFAAGADLPPPHRVFERVQRMCWERAAQGTTS